MDTNKENIQKLRDCIKDIKICMFTSLDTDGELHSRPMAMQEIDFDGELWFFAKKNSGKVLSIEKDSHVNLAFSHPDKQRFVSIAGSASMISDKKKAKELWSPMYQAWFPKGVDDPDLCLLQVHVHSAQYWDSPSSMTHILAFAKALLSGKKYSSEEPQKITIDHIH